MVVFTSFIIFIHTNDSSCYYSDGDVMYLCIDLKSFYASVECVVRNLDPYKTNLVVSDYTRGEFAITLAITPRLKEQGVKNRCRLYEIPSHIKYKRVLPRMNLYMNYSVYIYGIYLEYFSKDDIHVYSIDEVFIDIKPYLKLYNKTILELAKMILDDIYLKTKITATCGIGTNLYLAKVALDILAKHSKTNIAYLNEKLYREKLGNYAPLSDFFLIGSGIEARLNKLGIFTMNELSRYDESILYKEFGINALLLIDHAKGIETCTMKNIKSYVSKSKSISRSQTLLKDYSYYDALIVLKEMIDDLTLELYKNNYVTDQIFLKVGYSKNLVSSENLTYNLKIKTNRFSYLVKEYERLYCKSVLRTYKIRSLMIAFSNITVRRNEQLDLFSSLNELEKEDILSNKVNEIKSKYGKNIILRTISSLDVGNQKYRNGLVGGHNEK